MKKETQQVLYIMLGFIFGIAAKYFDSVDILGSVFTMMGVWIFICCLISYFSKAAKTAAINTLCFFVSMLAGYYLYTIFIVGFIPDLNVILRWALLALISPLFGAILTFCDDSGFLGALTSAVPISLLVLEGYPFLYTYKIPLLIDLAFALILFFLLRKNFKEKMYTLLCAAILFLLFNYLNVFSLLFGGV